jgi:hypothetical protein
MRERDKLHRPGTDSDCRRPSRAILQGRSPRPIVLAVTSPRPIVLAVTSPRPMGAEWVRDAIVSSRSKIPLETRTYPLEELRVIADRNR